MMKAALLVFASGLLVERERPVSKVIALLKDMQGQLTKEKAEDEEVYEKMSCWCKVNGKGKTTATEVAERRLADLESEIKALSSRASGLEQSLEKLSSELAENQEALASATALRAKERGEFEGAEKDMLVNIEALKNALTVLAKHQAFLQGSSTASFVSVQRSLKKVFRDPSMSDMMSEILNPTQKQQVEDFVQGGTASTGTNELLGVLRQLQTEMEKNLSDQQKSELQAQDDFKALKAAKTEEIDAASDKFKSKTQHLAKTSEALAEAKADHKDTTATLTADQAFLLDLEKRCAAADAEWEERSNTRAQELAAVGEAISILASDDAHDTFDTTFNFLQLVSVSRTASDRQQAAQRLLQTAVRTGSTALLRVATAAKLDGFEKVKGMISTMVTDLKKEAENEVKHKDWCGKEFENNDKETFNTQNEIEDLSTSIEALAAAIEDHTKDIKGMDGERAEMIVEMQRANENRQKQNWAFQQSIADQRATQVILKKALDRLQQFYLLQGGHKQEPAGPPPPAGFKPYEKSQGATGVLGMIKMIITDAQNLEKEATAAEQDAQTAYESFQRESYSTLQALDNAKTDKKEAKASAEIEKVQAEADRKDALQNSEDLSKYKGSLHQSCDFVLQNFDARQAARQQEVEALQQALSILSGAGR